MTPASDIRAAKEMLQSRGLLGDISARELATSANELGKSLVETLRFIRDMLTQAGK